MVKLTRELLGEIAERIIGTARELDSVVEQYDLEEDVSELEDRLLDVSVERCKGCDWWFESSDLDGTDPDGETRDVNIGYCRDCHTQEQAD